MNKWLWLGVAALLLLWTPFLYRELIAKAPEARDSDHGPSDDFVDGLEAEEGVPPKSLLAVPAAQPAPSEPAKPPPPAVEPPAAEEEPEAPEAPAPEEDPEGKQEPVPTAISAVGPVAELRSTFEEETRDAFWASSQEALLRELATKNEFDMAGKGEVACRRTVCRYSVYMDQEKPVNLLRLYSDVKGQVNMVAAMEPASPNDDITHVFMYVTRKGYAFSDVSEE